MLCYVSKICLICSQDIDASYKLILGPDPESQAILGPGIPLHPNSLFLFAKAKGKQRAKVHLLGTTRGLRIARSIVAMVGFTRPESDAAAMVSKHF